MKALSLAVLAFAVLSLGLGAAGKFDGGLLLGTAGLICAVSTFRSQKISSFLKIFVAIFASETVIFGLIVMAIKLGFWPEWARNYVIPDSLPLTVAVFEGSERVGGRLLSVKPPFVNDTFVELGWG
jgi:putative ATP-binding cassette transporter